MTRKDALEMLERCPDKELAEKYKKIGGFE